MQWASKRARGRFCDGELTAAISGGRRGERRRGGDAGLPGSCRAVGRKRELWRSRDPYEAEAGLACRLQLGKEDLAKF